MINERGLQRIQPYGEQLIKPLYADYSFGNIPTTIHYLLTGETLGPLLPPDCFGGSYPQPRRIVLFFIDSFGWQFWEEYHRRFATMRRVVDEGTLTPISALFPSTTSGSVSTMSLGVLPAQHALYEWFIYIDAYGEVIQSLPFMPVGSHVQDACLAKGYDPALLLRRHETVAQRLARHGVTTIQFSNRSYAYSAYNRIISAGSEVVTHTSLAEALVQMKERLAAATDKTLLSFYWADIDSVAHHYGPSSTYHAAEITNFWLTFDAVFSNVASGAPGDTLFLFTADHGHAPSNPAATYYLNQRLPALVDCLRTTPRGAPITPGGSPHDAFLHIKPERRGEALALLQRELDGQALVLPIDQALADGLFGPPPYDAEFRRRLGDILILAYPGHDIWWLEHDAQGNTRLSNRLRGHHGGLSRAEMLTVLGAAYAL